MWTDRHRTRHETRLKDMVPSLGRQLHEDEALLDELSEYTARTLQITPRENRDLG